MVGWVQDAVIAGRSGRSQAEAEIQRRWQKGNRRCHKEALGGVPCREESGDANRGKEACCEEYRCQESASEGFTEGRKEGCPHATAESRRDSCSPGGDRVALAKSAAFFAGTTWV